MARGWLLGDVGVRGEVEESLTREAWGVAFRRN